MTPAPRPIVFTVTEATPAEVPGLDSVRCEAADLAVEVRASGAPRWLLLGSGTGVEVVCQYAAEVLAGRAPVFGLAGVVVVGAPPEVDLGALPVLVLDAEDGPAVERFWHERAGLGPTVPADFAAMIASDRVSARTRGIHARRALADDPAYVPVALDPTRLATLRVLADLVVPQDGPGVDLAARVDGQLGRGEGDGWRHVDLPPDLAAYRAGLDELAALGSQGAEEQDAALTAVAAGELSTTGPLSGEQLALWFEDVVNDLVRQWVAHPATMSRIGYDGFANGGDAEFGGFVELGAGAREAWEPAMSPARSNDGAAR